MQFLDKWQRSRLTSGDFICSILLDSIDHHQKQRGKVQHIDRDDFKAVQTRLLIRNSLARSNLPRLLEKATKPISNLKDFYTCPEPAGA